MFAPISFGRRYNWLSPTNAFAVAVFAMALSINAIGQTPDLRKVAATGPDYPGLEEQPVWETEIAAGSSRLIAVFNVGPRSAAPDGISRIGYALRSRMATADRERGR